MIDCKINQFECSFFVFNRHVEKNLTVFFFLCLVAFLAIHQKQDLS